MKYLFLLFSIAAFVGCQEEPQIPNEDLPVARFTYTSFDSLPVSVAFTNTSTIPGGTATYLWDFGDGSSSNATNPVHDYSTPGVFSVMLVQVPSAGSPDTIVKVITIPAGLAGPSGSAGRPQGVSNADFTFSIIPSPPFTVNFTNASTGATSYLWSFGDGNTSNSSLTTVIHNYNSAGPFTVILSATNSAGTDTTSTIIRF